MRTIQRIIRRAALPIEYSKGFNPHMSISLAQPLSVGMYSCGDYMDIELKEELEENYIKDSLNKNAPLGVKIIEVVKVRENSSGKKVPQSMALIDADKYLIKIKYEETSKLKEEIDKLLEEKEWSAVKKSKSGEKVVNIKDMVKSFNYTVSDNILTITAVVSCGSKENLSADLLAKFTKSKTTSVNEEAFVDIMREEMFVQLNDNYVPIYNYVR